MKSWRSIVAVVAGLLVPGTRAQTGTLVDLGSLLSDQKNLTTFYGLIQVCGIAIVIPDGGERLTALRLYRNTRRFYYNYLHIKASQ